MTCQNTGCTNEVPAGSSKYCGKKCKHQVACRAYRARNGAVAKVPVGVVSEVASSAALDKGDGEAPPAAEDLRKVEEPKPVEVTVAEVNAATGKTERVIKKLVRRAKMSKPKAESAVVVRHVAERARRIGKKSIKKAKPLKARKSKSSKRGPYVRHVKKIDASKPRRDGKCHMCPKKAKHGRGLYCSDECRVKGARAKYNARHAKA